MIRILLTHLFFITHCLVNAKETDVIMKESFDPNALVLESATTQNFMQFVISNDFIVDKSLLIKNIVEDAGKQFLIICPTGWGKSLNLDMIKTFLRIYNDETNYTTTLSLRSNYRLFVDGEIGPSGDLRRFEKPFLIAKDKYFIETYLGLWPVIHIDFGFSFGNANYSAMLEGIRYCVSLAFEEHTLVAKNKLLQKVYSNTTDPMTKNTARRQLKLFQNIVSNKASVSEADLETSIVFLSKLLHEYYEKKVFLLIDDFMEPLQECILFDEIPKEDKEKFVKFYHSFLSKSSKTNVHLEKAILTGEFLPTEDLQQFAFSQAVECSSLTGKFMNYYGFDNEEVKELFDRIHIPTNTLQQVRQRYEGYKINQKKDLVYHPWSIMKYITSRSLDEDSMDRTNVEDYILNFLGVTLFREKFRHLLNHEDIIITPRRYFPIDELERQIKVLACTRDAINFGNRLTEGAFLFLYQLGYLTLSEDCSYENKNLTLSVVFPNDYIRKFMNLKFDSHY